MEVRESCASIMKKEYREVGFNATLLILAVVVALYRF